MVIVGLTGLPKSGRKSAAKFLVEKYGFIYINLTEEEDSFLKNLDDKNFVMQNNDDDLNEKKDIYFITEKTLKKKEEKINFDRKAATSNNEEDTNKKKQEGTFHNNNNNNNDKYVNVSLFSSGSSAGFSESSRGEINNITNNIPPITDNSTYVSFPSPPSLFFSSSCISSVSSVNFSSSSSSSSSSSFSSSSSSFSSSSSSFSSSSSSSESVSPPSYLSTASEISWASSSGGKICGICNSKTCAKTNKNVFLKYQKIKTAVAENVLKKLMQNWRLNYVLSPVTAMCQIEIFKRRPFFLLLSLEAPAALRIKRSEKILQKKNENEKNLQKKNENEKNNLLEKCKHISCYDWEEFARNDDMWSFGCRGEVRECMSRRDICVQNVESLASFREKIAELDITNKELIRPSWDAYFMRLAFLAATRSNCMKRRVGALVVRDKRLVSTGYNGTPSGILNCSEGGCVRCNNPSISQGQALEACECIHAEVNALLEAGRDRCIGGAMYVTCTPCLGCAKLIIQTGIKRVLYGTEYDQDGAAIKLLRKSSVVVKKFSDEHPHVPFVTSPVFY